ncbi:DsbC family protein [Aliikangiella coralliicola]|uniref:Thiol:disulfide interchange protein n=1 Tax=Aliikangiella coralliicola TaxID=2592383 RepID=A0A545UAG4_9GAMM|nr:DsbC family protein [Aliikangiella coralliicola]TQV86450.1 DsbC family protein [Aliikangiella coralliicola]
MSIKQKLTVSGVVIFSALILGYGVSSREALDTQVSQEPGSIKSAQTESRPASLTATPTSADGKILEEIKISLEKKLPGIEIIAVEPSPLEGFYQAFYGDELLYVTADGRFLFTGNLLELAKERPINHSQVAIMAMDKKRAPARAEAIAQVSESDMVVFKAEEEKYVVTVFTDVDCAYCRKLHREIPQLNSGGVTVRYMAYPRAGIGSDAYRKLVSVWCADDKTAAMDDAKLKRKFGQKSCKNPIADQFKMTRSLSLSGTPAIILSTGEIVGGYLPAAQLINVLSEKLADSPDSSKNTGQSGR